MNKFKDLRKKLSKLGINKAQAEAGTSEGHPAIWLRWNGDSEVYTGHDEMNPFDPMADRVARFEDSNLQ